MTLEQFVLVIDAARNLEGIRKDMRQNASNYKSRLSVNQSVDSVSKLMRSDNAEYQRRLGWIKKLYDINQAALSSALTAMGITLAHTIATYQELKNIADATDAASLTSSQEIISRADEILANVSQHLTVWD